MHSQLNKHNVMNGERGSREAPSLFLHIIAKCDLTRFNPIPYTYIGFYK